MNERRPPEYDLVAYLLEHPEHCDSSIAVLARAIGCNYVTVLYQLGQAIHEGRCYLRTVIVPKKKKSDRKGSSKKLKEVSSESLIERFFSLRMARRQYQRNRDPEERRDYQREHRAEWVKDPESKAKLSANSKRYRNKKDVQ